MRSPSQGDTEMPTIQEQYTEFAQHTQEATMAIAQAWTAAAQEAATRVPVAITPEAATAAAQDFIDQAYDFVTKVIDVQRDLSKKFLTSSATVAGNVVEQATKALNEAGTQAFEAATKAGRGQQSAE
jgi:hypothetical protein